MLPKGPSLSTVITVLCGGVGAARMLAALARVVDEGDLVALVNVGDDLVLHGLTICPDLDTILYTLSGRHDEERGWGRRDESWTVRDELARLGGATWFSLGDLDLATHLYRTQRLAEGATKGVVAAELAERLEVRARLLPVTDDPLATELDTEVGRLSFQEYFVAHRHGVAVSAVHVTGATTARPAPGVLEALAEAQRIVIAPSNPLVSIGPLLAVAGVRDALAARRDDVVAVSPIVGGTALKGPADRLLAELGYDVSPLGVADVYRGLVGTMVIDEVDAGLAPDLEARGVRGVVSPTVMSRPGVPELLARAVLA
jgi:LPPG:FO 2-phospho-L-lactate transferase